MDEAAVHDIWLAILAVGCGVKGTFDIEEYETLWNKVKDEGTNKGKGKGKGKCKGKT